MFSMSLERDGHIRHYSICSSGSAGWEVRLEADRQLTRCVNYHDWHRVERAHDIFVREVSELTARGWQIVGDEVEA